MKNLVFQHAERTRATVNLDSLYAERWSSFDRDYWREVGTIPWYGPEYSLDDLVVDQWYGHQREHDPQLKAVVEAAGR